MPVLSHTMAARRQLSFLAGKESAAHEVFASFSEFRRIAFLWCKFALSRSQPPQPRRRNPRKAEGRKEAAYSRREKWCRRSISLKIDGKEIKYTATAGTILLKLEDGTPKASIFYVAYTKD